MLAFSLLLYNFPVSITIFSGEKMEEVIERKPVKNIDFNCDLAQSYGIYKNKIRSGT